MSEQNNTLAEILTGKKEILRLILLATVLSFSVGMLASLVAASTIAPTSTLYWFAALVTAAVLLLLASDMRKRLSFEDRLEGVLFIDSAKNELLNVRSYELAQDLSRTMKAVQAESRAIYAEWESDPLVQRKRTNTANKPSTSGEEVRYFSIIRVEANDEDLPKQKASLLLDEAIQFVLLEELSTHLSTYFNNSQTNQVAELSREDIPTFLLQNRVLNLLCTPIEQRDIFIKAFPNQAERPNGVIFSVWGSDGSMYSRFDLKLPKDSKISFLSRNALRIETKRFNLEISGRYTGSSANVSRSFTDCYMDKRWDDLDFRKIEVTLKGSVRPLSLLTNKGWEYYKWLDSFRTRLRKSVDFKSFQDEINWRTVEPMLHSLRGRFTALHGHLKHLHENARVGKLQSDHTDQPH